MLARLSLSRPGRLVALVAVACALWAASLHAGTLDFSGTAVPLPATLFLITAGLGSAAALRRRAGERARD
jgi:hypothetical protein